MATIKDVAKLAGVTPSTVSRVLNGKSPSAASDKTKEKIWKAVRETGYSVNEMARELRKPKNVDATQDHFIDCILARELDYFLDPFLSSIRRVIEEELFMNNYRLRAQFGLSDLAEHVRSDSEKKGAAVIIGRIDAANLKILKMIYTHLIYVGLQDLELGIDSVMCSGYNAVTTLMDYLYSLGHRKICYLGETKDEQRFNSYLDSQKRLQLPHTKQQIVDVLFTPSDSYVGLKKALDKGFDCTAILCANDTSVVGVLKALKEAHKDVPRDVSVVGINDVEDVRYLDPMITTISFPTEEMGKHVVRLLLDRMEGKHYSPVKLYLPGQLIVRDSCMRVD